MLLLYVVRYDQRQTGQDNRFHEITRRCGTRFILHPQRKWRPFSLFLWFCYSLRKNIFFPAVDLLTRTLYLLAALNILRLAVCRHTFLRIIRRVMTLRARRGWQRFCNSGISNSTLIDSLLARRRAVSQAGLYSRC